MNRDSETAARAVQTARAPQVVGAQRECATTEGRMHDTTHTPQHQRPSLKYSFTFDQGHKSRGAIRRKTRTSGQAYKRGRAYQSRSTVDNTSCGSVSRREREASLASQCQPVPASASINQHRLTEAPRRLVSPRLASPHLASHRLDSPHLTSHVSRQRICTPAGSQVQRRRWRRE